MKRSLSFTYDESLSLENIENDIQLAFKRKQTVSVASAAHQSNSNTKTKNILTDSNTLGLLSPPVTPENLKRVNVINENELSSVKKKIDLNQTDDNENSINIIENINVSPYTKGKNLFLRGSKIEVSENDYNLIGRESESKKLKSILNNCLENSVSKSLYISGPPGTGKTAQINCLLDSYIKQNIENNNSNITDKLQYQMDNELSGSAGKSKIMLNDGSERMIRISKINCMTIKRPDDIFNIIYLDLINKKRKNISLKKKNSDELRELLLNDNEIDMNIIVLDELDNLINKSQQVLFELFSMASSSVNNSNCKLILIGISNALDLTDRFLPRLKSNRIGPEVIPFLPYTSDQIKNVIHFKLNQLMENSSSFSQNQQQPQQQPPLIHPAAIQLCAKKCSVNTGDLRKAFDICHRSLELTEQMVKKKLSTSDYQNLNLTTAPKVTISQVSKICNSAFGINFFTKLENLNLQHKSVLCSLIKFEESNQKSVQPQTKSLGRPRLNFNSKSNSNSNYSIHSFFEFYSTKLNFEKKIGILKRNDFLEVLSTLESNGLINLSKGSLQFSTSKISTNVPKIEVLKVIQDIGILKKILTTE
ncbi:hypothetical protein B5S28_g1301 [[Candida] boidinii]|nr:hypothetical protein B5S28_g1301 [[Candida] boidinii]OWB60760.1 hypothetical protein B5S29_g1641 [[Candida] boidinii]OWB70852.1 hypothetical protein B5S31_g533 [[Candida] boidinii]